MKKYFVGIIAFVLLAVPVLADEYNAWVVKADGEQLEAMFVVQNGTSVTLRVEGQLVNFNTGELGVVIFDNNYTDFYKDLSHSIQRCEAQMADFLIAGKEKEGLIMVGKREALREMRFMLEAYKLKEEEENAG